MHFAWAVAAAILVAAATLRVLAANSGGLWLDEIWSLQLAEGLTSGFDVLRIRQDNNHPLNTLVLSLLAQGSGPGDFLWLRTPAIVAGVASTALAGCLSWRRGAAEACVAMLLVGTSWLMIHYSSEARGYAFAQLFALTSLLAVSRRDVATPLWCLLFHASVLLGLLSHFSFVHVYGAILAWWVWSRRSEQLAPAALEFAKWQLLPVIFTLTLYWVYARGLPIAGGPEQQIADLFAHAGALAIGLSGNGMSRWIGGGLALALCIGGIGWLARRGQDRWVLYATGIVALPILTLVIQKPEFVAPRYFLLSVLLLLLLLAEIAGDLLRGSRGKQIAAALLLIGFVVGNTVQTRAFLQAGRGRYWQALVFMAERSEGKAIHVGADHDIRVGLVLGYYARLLPSGKRLAYHRQKHWPEGGPEWLVQHRHGSIEPAEKNIVSKQGNPYRLERVFPTGALSGSHWLVYRAAPDGRG